MRPAGTAQPHARPNSPPPPPTSSDDQGLGKAHIELGFILRRNPDVVRAPDVSFVAAVRVPKLPATGFAPFAPDLAVEVLSPDESYADVLQKVGEYLEAGCPLVWVIDPRRRQAVVHATARPPRILGLADTLSGEDSVPGFELPMASLFE